MPRTLVSALAAPISAGSAEIVFIPEGKHRITPGSQPEGIVVNVPPERGAAIAATLQADLDLRLQQNVQPWFDFEHTRKHPASGQPKAFRYEPGKGIMCKVEWSRSGRLAIKGNDVNYFSPEFFIDDDGVPDGLPERGPLGGLVTEPAFRDIPRISASHADQPAKNDPPAMSKFIILASIGLLSHEEAALEDAESLARNRVTAFRSKADKHDELQTKVTAAENERDGYKVKLQTAETKIESSNKKRAEDLVKAAIADGRIAPKDEDKATKFRDKIAGGDSFAEEMLASLPKLTKGLDKPLISASNADRQTVVARDGEHAFETEARKMVTAGQAKTEVEAFGILSRDRPDLYEDYTKQFEAE